MSTRAVIYLPPGVDRDRWLSRCLEHCERRRYLVVSIVQVESGWHDVHQMLTNDEADVVVVGRFAHLDPTRTPRIEEATDYGDTPRTRRPKRM